MTLAATGAALGTAVGVVALTPGHAPKAANPVQAVRPALKLTPTQRVLYRLSSRAAGQPAAQGRYVVMSTEGADNGVINVRNTAVLDSLTGDLREDQKGTDGLPSGAGSLSRHFSPTAAQFAAIRDVRKPGRGRGPRNDGHLSSGFRHRHAAGPQWDGHRCQRDGVPVHHPQRHRPAQPLRRLRRSPLPWLPVMPGARDHRIIVGGSGGGSVGVLFEGGLPDLLVLVPGVS